MSIKDRTIRMLTDNHQKLTVRFGKLLDTVQIMAEKLSDSAVDYQSLRNTVGLLEKRLDRLNHETTLSCMQHTNELGKKYEDELESIKMMQSYMYKRIDELAKRTDMPNQRCREDNNEGLDDELNPDPIIMAALEKHWHLLSPETKSDVDLAARIGEDEDEGEGLKRLDPKTKLRCAAIMHGGILPDGRTFDEAYSSIPFEGCGEDDDE